MYIQLWFSARFGAEKRSDAEISLQTMALRREQKNFLGGSKKYLGWENICGSKLYVKCWNLNHYIRTAIAD